MKKDDTKAKRERRIEIYHRYVNVRAWGVTVDREKARLVRLARLEGIELDMSVLHDIEGVEEKIADRLINKRFLSELIAGNQLSITNRYCPKKHAEYVGSLQSVVVWWIRWMIKKDKLILNLEKLGIKKK